MLARFGVIIAALLLLGAESCGEWDIGGFVFPLGNVDPVISTQDVPVAADVSSAILPVLAE